MSDFYNKYPYTDFHELNLDWVIERVKKLTEDWLATQQEWNDTKEQWQQLYDYVHDYFDNLDVSQEINDKIDAMVSDGTFLDVIRSTVETQTITTTTSWLADHITQPTTPAIDTSLTIAGAAADALVTGNAIRNDEDAAEFTGLNNKAVLAPLYEVGNITYGSDSVDNMCIRTPNKYVCKGSVIVKNYSAYQLYVKISRYNASDVFYSEQQVNINSGDTYTFSMPRNDYKFRISLGTVGNIVRPDWTFLKIYINTDFDQMKISSLDVAYNSPLTRIDSIEKLFKNDRIPINVTWEQGTLAADGSLYPSTYRIRTDYIEIDPDLILDFVANNPNRNAVGLYEYTIQLFDADKMYLGYPAGWTDWSSTNVRRKFANAYYFRISVRKNGDGEVLDPTHPENYISMYRYAKNIDTEYFVNDKWISYGDSMTGGVNWQWQPYIEADLPIFNHFNRGIGGTTVSIADGRPNPFCDSTRINNSIPVDTKLITVMGGTNDFGANVPLGDFSYPFNENTYIGAYCSTIEKMQNRAPGAEIIVMSQPNTRGAVDGGGTPVNGTPEVNALGLTDKDYADASLEVARYFGLHHIDVFGECGINPFNRASYTQDVIHPNEAGFKKIAQCIYSNLKTFYTFS